MEQSLLNYSNTPVIEYFGKKFSAEWLIKRVETWAKTFKTLGVKEDEVIAFYGPFVPDICAMALAINKIGAVAYFLKLAISAEALADETKECRFAVVFEGMWQNVQAEFCKEKFEKVIFYSVTDHMPIVMRMLVKSMDRLKGNKRAYTPNDKFIPALKAANIGLNYSGKTQAAFKPNRSVFITSSSGSTVGGIVKGTVATNETTIAQLLMAEASNVQFVKEERILNNFPPTASTSLNVLFLLAIYRGMTICMDPRVSAADFKKQVLNNKPNAVLITGAMWDTFFTSIAAEIARGKRIDLSFARAWIIGGDGTTPAKLKKWNEILKKCNGHPLYSGYGSSELFSAITVDYISADGNADNKRPVIGIGIPYAGCTVAVFDETDNELPYNSRGELRIKSLSAMKEYYNKPELTKETLADGWVHSGDLAEISEDGFVYLYGRCKDSIELENSGKLYLFDIENEIKKHPLIGDAIVVRNKYDNIPSHLYAHLEWIKTLNDDEQKKAINEIDICLKQYLPAELKIAGYAIHQKIPYSSTTLKRDKNHLFSQQGGFITVQLH